MVLCTRPSQQWWIVKLAQDLFLRIDRCRRWDNVTCLLTGCGGWIRVLCQTPTGYTFLCSKLLRGVWQCRRHDECWRIAHVLLPGSVKTEGKLTWCWYSFEGIITERHTHSFSLCLCFYYLKILKPSEKKAKYQYGGVNSGRPVTPPRTAQAPKKRWTCSLVSSPSFSPCPPTVCH